MIEIEEGEGPNFPCGFQAHQTHVLTHPTEDEAPFTCFSSKPMPAEKINPVPFVPGGVEKVRKVAAKVCEKSRNYNSTDSTAWDEFLKEFPTNDNVREFTRAFSEPTDGILLQVDDYLADGHTLHVPFRDILFGPERGPIKEEDITEEALHTGAINGDHLRQYCTVGTLCHAGQRQPPEGGATRIPIDGLPSDLQKKTSRRRKASEKAVSSKDATGCRRRQQRQKPSDENDDVLCDEEKSTSSEEENGCRRSRKRRQPIDDIGEYEKLREVHKAALDNFCEIEGLEPIYSMHKDGVESGKTTTERPSQKMRVDNTIGDNNAPMDLSSDKQGVDDEDDVIEELIEGYYRMGRWETSCMHQKNSRNQKRFFDKYVGAVLDDLNEDTGVVEKRIVVDIEWKIDENDEYEPQYALVTDFYPKIDNTSSLESYTLYGELFELFGAAIRREFKEKRNLTVSHTPITSEQLVDMAQITPMEECNPSTAEVTEIPMHSFSDLSPFDQRFVPLSPEELEAVNDVFLEPFDDTVLKTKFNINITKRKLSCLRAGVWINDEIVNFYMQLLQERNERRSHKFGTKRSHYFNSFFMQKLLENEEYTFANVKK